MSGKGKNEKLGMLDPEFQRVCMETITQSEGSGGFVGEKLHDRDGNFMYVWNYDGLPIPKMPFVEKSIPELRSTFKVRDDDVFICAFPSSGTHWFWEMLCMLLKEKAEYLTGAKEQDMMEFLLPGFFEQKESPRVLNTHLRPKHLPEKMVKEGKVILVVRNPKDVVVSNYRQTYGLRMLGYEGTFPSFLELFLEGQIHYGSWFDYINDWMEAKEKNSNILMVTYEEAKKDLPALLKRLSSYLNLDVNDELIEKIAELCTFKAMKNAKDNEIAKMGLFREGCGFYRSGKSGTWKDWLTVAQNERMDEALKTKLKSHEVSQRYLPSS